MILQLQNIAFSFTTNVTLFSGLTLSLEQGNIYALMGANGAGKTTLFNIIAGFLKPKEGSILFKEKDITREEPYVINRLGISRTFQDLRLINKLTVKENILLAMQNNPTDDWLKALLPLSFYSNQLKQLELTAEKLLDDYYLAEVANNKAGEISYGQQKLLTLACCIANGAELLLLDEPVAGINPVYRDNMLQLLMQLKGKGKTILLIEHNTDFINEVADGIFFLQEGSIHSYKTIEQLKTDPAVMEAFI